jgi:hypothetical protein
MYACMLTTLSQNFLSLLCVNSTHTAMNTITKISSLNAVHDLPLIFQVAYLIVKLGFRRVHVALYRNFNVVYLSCTWRRHIITPPTQTSIRFDCFYLVKVWGTSVKRRCVSMNVYRR